MISVVIPVYNRPILVKRAIESVLKQTLKADEIIVVDDGSDDDTLSVLKTFKDQIKIITQKNSGVSSARNSGIKLAKNEWIALLDSDDVWDESKLEKQMAFCTQSPHILFIHTQELWIRNDKIIKQKKQHQKPKGFCFESNLDFCKIAPSTAMISKSVFEDVGYFDEDLEVCEDYDLWLRILKKYELGLVDEQLSTKYAGHDQLSFKYHSMDIYRIKALLKHKEHPLVKLEIEKKLEIMLKGAVKHENKKVIAFCEEVLENIAR